jgi:hypothetical protein
LSHKYMMKMMMVITDDEADVNDDGDNDGDA